MPEKENYLAFKYISVMANLVALVYVNIQSGSRRLRRNCENWRTRSKLLKIPSIPRHRNPKTLTLDFCLKKPRSYAGKSPSFLKMCVLKNVFHPHENEKLTISNSSGLKNVFEKSRYGDGIVWTVGHPVKQSCVFNRVVWTLPNEASTETFSFQLHETKRIVYPI